MIDNNTLADILTVHAVASKSKTDYSAADVTDKMLNLFNNEMDKFYDIYPNFDIEANDYNGAEDDEFMDILIKVAKEGGYKLIEELEDDNGGPEDDTSVEDIINKGDIFTDDSLMEMYSHIMNTKPELLESFEQLMANHIDISKSTNDHIVIAEGKHKVLTSSVSIFLKENGIVAPTTNISEENISPTFKELVGFDSKNKSQDEIIDFLSKAFIFVKNKNNPKDEIDIILLKHSTISGLIKEVQIDKNDPLNKDGVDGDKPNEQDGSVATKDADNTDGEGTAHGDSTMPTQDDKDLGDGQPIKLKEGDKVESDVFSGSILKVREEDFDYEYDHEDGVVECEVPMDYNKFYESKNIKINDIVMKVVEGKLFEDKSTESTDDQEGSKTDDNTNIPASNTDRENDPNIKTQPLDLEKGDKVKIGSVEGTVSKTTKDGVEVETDNGEVENIAMDGLNINEGCTVNGKSVVIKEGVILEATVSVAESTMESLKDDIKKEYPEVGDENFSSKGSNLHVKNFHPDLKSWLEKNYDSGSPDGINTFKSNDEEWFDIPFANESNIIKESLKDDIKKAFPEMKDSDFSSQSSDLHIKYSPEVLKWIEDNYEYGKGKSIVSTFNSDDGTGKWIEVAFANESVNEKEGITLTPDGTDKKTGKTIYKGSDGKKYLHDDGDKYTVIKEDDMPINDDTDIYTIGKHKLVDGDTYKTKEGTEVIFMGHDDAEEAEDKNYLFDDGNGVTNYSKEEVESLLEALTYKNTYKYGAGDDTDKLNRIYDIAVDDDKDIKGKGLEVMKIGSLYSVTMDGKEIATLEGSTLRTDMELRDFEKIINETASIDKSPIVENADEDEVGDEVEVTGDRGVGIYGVKLLEPYTGPDSQSGEEIWQAEISKIKNQRYDYGVGDKVYVVKGDYGKNWGGIDPFIESNEDLGDEGKDTKSVHIPTFESFQKSKSKNNKLDESLKLPKFRTFLENKK